MLPTLTGYSGGAIAVPSLDVSCRWAGAVAPGLLAQRRSHTLVVLHEFDAVAVEVLDERDRHRPAVELLLRPTDLQPAAIALS